MKLGRKILYAGLTVAIIAIAALNFTGGTPVETVEVKTGDITRAVVDTGYVQPSENYDIHSTQMARVVKKMVETGQTVKQGQTLALLENRDLTLQAGEFRSQLSQAVAAVPGARAAVERSELDLQDARENLKRVQELHRTGAISQAEYEKSRLQTETLQRTLGEQKSRLESLQAQVAGLSQSLEQVTAKEQQLVIKSPVEGIVLNLPVQQEQVLSPGALVATVAVAERLEIKADILSDDLAWVKPGQKVIVTAPVLGEGSLSGEVINIYPRAEEKVSALGVVQRRVPVIISLKDPANLKPGYEVRVSIETLTRRGVLLLPREAVRTAGDGRREVIMAVNGKTRRQAVENGISDHRNIEITGGLEAGNLVVRDASLNLADNTRISR